MFRKSKICPDNLKRSMRYAFPYVLAGLLTIALLLYLLWPSVFISVREGEGGVLYRRMFGGTVVDQVYGEGLHVIWPWDTMTIYNARVTTVNHEFDVLTTGGLPIHLRITTRYFPEYDMLGVLHKRVGPNYVNEVVIPQVESVLRKSIGQYHPEVIYTTQRGVLDDIIMQALEEAGQKFIRIDEVIIRSIELPEPIRQAIEAKLVQEQQMQAYTFRLEKEEKEAARKKIEAEGITTYQRIISSTLDDKLLRWQGVVATERLAASNNAKIVVIGSGKDGLPLILGGN